MGLRQGGGGGGKGEGETGESPGWTRRALEHLLARCHIPMIDS